MKETIISVLVWISIYIFIIILWLMFVWIYNQTKIWEKEWIEFDKQIEYQKQRCLNYWFWYYETWDNRINCINYK